MILILDIGKTNKKCLVFDPDYRIVFEKSIQLPETTDEDGFPCEDLELLQKWVLDVLQTVLGKRKFPIKAINCTTYGASFVHLNAQGQALTPLYNYLKPFPETLRKSFFDQYGDAEKISLETASPDLGNLNSGLQLYWLKQCKPLIYNQIKWSLHLPQHIAYWIQNHLNPDHPKEPQSEITSIGCHTMLWNFQENEYHHWVKAEGLIEKFPPIVKSGGDLESPPDLTIGAGLHDSSAALIPYLACFEEPFVLISTGTWCISLNPFNQEPLTAGELAQDTLCYMTYEGDPVKAARYFGGNEHETMTKKLAEEFGVAEDFYQSVDLSENAKLWERYQIFMRQLVEKQAHSTRLAIGKTRVKRLFVDGGFSKNETYMRLLAAAFPELDVFAAEIAQATALGAAMAIHNQWNPKPIPDNLISLKHIFYDDSIQSKIPLY